MLSDCRPEKELGMKKVQLGRMEEHDLIFLMGDTGGWEKETGRPSSLLVWAARGTVLNGMHFTFCPSSALSRVYLDSDRIIRGL